MNGYSWQFQENFRYVTGVAMGYGFGYHAMGGSLSSSLGNALGFGVVGLILFCTVSRVGWRRTTP